MDLLDDLLPFIDRVARNTSSSYPGYVEFDDVRSELICWFLDNEHTVAKLIRDNESWQPMLYATMAKTAHAFMQQHEADVNGYSTDDVYQYSTNAVRTLLEDAFEYEDWQSFSTFGDGQPKSKRVGPTSDRVDMLIDVKRAVEQLTKSQAEIIYWRYKYRIDFDIIADSLGVSENAARKRLERAVGAVRKLLGKKSLADMRNGWEAREPRMSTAQALTYQESIY